MGGPAGPSSRAAITAALVSLASPALAEAAGAASDRLLLGPAGASRSRSRRGRRWSQERLPAVGRSVLRRVGQTPSVTAGRDACLPVPGPAPGPLLRVTGHAAGANLGALRRQHPCPTTGPPHSTVTTCSGGRQSGHWAPAPRRRSPACRSSRGPDRLRLRRRECVVGGKRVHDRGRALPARDRAQRRRPSAGPAPARSPGRSAPPSDADFFGLGAPASGWRSSRSSTAWRRNSSDFDPADHDRGGHPRVRRRRQRLLFGALRPNVEGRSLTGPTPSRA